MMDSLQFLTDDMIRCHRLGYTLKCITGTEVLFAIIFVLLSNYWLVIPIVFSILGYIGAKQYNTQVILSYGVYIGLGLIGKWSILIYNWFHTSDKRVYIATSALSMDTIISLWALFVIYKLIKLLKTIPVLNLSALKTHGTPTETYLVLGTEK